MITASHNGIEDNGVKIVDADGGMLVRTWEKVCRALSDFFRFFSCSPSSHFALFPIFNFLCLKYACDLVNAAPGTLSEVLATISKAEGLDIGAGSGKKMVVLLGRDTRPSSPRLFELCRKGALAVGATVHDSGIVTTPQLHHVVRMYNITSPEKERYGGLEGYVNMLADGYAGVLGHLTPNVSHRGPLVVDCAHGVGAIAAAALSTRFSPFVEMQLRNRGETPAEQLCLNEGVGAEHCQKERLPPAGFTPADILLRCASLDGDADRLVYHYFSKSGWNLLDGDKIACLCAAFLSDLLRDSGLSFTGEPAHATHGVPEGHPENHSPGEALESLLASPVSVGIVQTAYANGASSAYISSHLGLPVLLAKTGVKYVHAAAAAFDIGVYFEANGHGTVLFHPSFSSRLEVAVTGLSTQSLEARLGSSAAAAALSRLYWSTRLINQAVGDALSDALFVEAVLSVKGWSVENWDAVYSDLPSRQAKLPVKDRGVIITTEDESRVISPPELQQAIDALVAKVPRGRAFVRPSGTEDVVRAYAEAETQVAADSLCRAVIRATFDLAGGVGTPPPPS